MAQVFAELADGRFHSGEALARTLGVSRSAIWKAVAALKALGSELHAVRNRGYRLARGSEPLDPARIRDRLTAEARAHVARIDSVWSIDSTNTALLERVNPRHGTCEVLLAEYQTAGRGRRGRTWLAPPGGAICLSLSWSFRDVPQDLAALGLAMGVCALRALRVHGFDGVTLKWPNDLLIGERKLGGVLIDLRAESAGPASVVIGIGLNLALGAALLGQIASSGTAATDLASTERPLPARNALAGALLSACVGGLRAFERDGLKPFVEDWRAADALRGRAVSVSAADGLARGIARGIDLRGALMLETPAGLRRFISGDVSVRL
jgi:BirA family transcriptional regulator, biotin operon repressor / biotin---[acetyl-CoA-carboxylase] ligase